MQTYRDTFQNASAPQQPTPSTQIDRLISELQTIASNINGLCQRCDSMAVRHLGAEPAPPSQGVSESKLSPVPTGTFGEAGAKIQGIHSSIIHLETLVSRLEQI